MPSLLQTRNASSYSCLAETWCVQRYLEVETMESPHSIYMSVGTFGLQVLISVVGIAKREMNGLLGSWLAISTLKNKV